MLEKGTITQAEYDEAIKDIQETTGKRGAEESNNFVMGKWSTTLYGFVQADYIHDTTQSYSELAGSGFVSRAGTLAGDNGRTQFSVRDSRIGLRLRAPEYNGIRASMQFEGDFVVDQVPGPGEGNGWTIAEGNFFTNPILRIRHMFLKVENPIVDVLMGQTWHLFGWQSTYMPNTDEWQGVPGELYSRTPQIRLSKTFESDDVAFDIAIAASRPPQRDSSYPEGEGGIHLAYKKWTASQTIGQTGTTVSPLSIAVTGDVRHFEIPQFSGKPTNFNTKNTGALAVDAFIPVLPGTKKDMGNSFSLLGEAATGYGFTDMYTGLQSGVTFPSLPLPAGAPAPYPGTYNFNGYNPDVDPGFVGYNTSGQLEAVQYTAYRIGASYFFPGLNGKMFLSGNFSRTTSNNAKDFGGAAGGTPNPSGTLSALDWFNVVLMGDITPAVRLALEYQNYNTEYNDGMHAINHRIMASGFYMF
jgi:hypothetical protein